MSTPTASGVTTDQASASASTSASAGVTGSSSDVTTSMVTTVGVGTFGDSTSSSSGELEPTTTDVLPLEPLSLYFAHQNVVGRLQVDESGVLTFDTVCDNVDLEANTLISGMAFIEGRLMATISNTVSPSAEVRLVELDACGCAGPTAEGSLSGVLSANALSTESAGMGPERLLVLEPARDVAKLWRITNIGAQTVESVTDISLAGTRYGFTYAQGQSYLWDADDSVVYELDSEFAISNESPTTADGSGAALEWDRVHERLLACERVDNDWTLGEFDPNGTFIPYFPMPSGCSSLAFPPEEPLCD